MHGENQRPEDDVLDLHLGHLGDDQRSRLETELLRDPDFRARSDRLAKLLRPLDNWKVTPPPANLADNVLRFVRQATSDRTPGVVPITEGGVHRPSPFGSIRQLIAVAACIAALISVVGPGLSQVRARSYRAACASNLGSIFRGTTLYQQAFGGSLPFAGNLPRAAWLPSGAGDRPYQSNSRHIYLVAKLNYGPSPKDFICPADRTAKPMKVDELAVYDDFASACNISYGSLSMGGSHPNLRPPIPIAYMSDPNPLFVNARFNGSVDPTRTNSPAHRGRGQRVLILNGSVTRLTVPVYGPRKDNLWLSGTVRRYVGTEAPSCKTDSFLIPGYPSTDPAVLSKFAK